MTRRQRAMMIVTGSLLLCLVVLSLGSSRRLAQAQDDADLIAPADTAACLECHGESVNHDRFLPSAHGKLNCQQCHKGINQYPHPEHATFKPQCATCHQGQAGAFAKSRHAHPKAASNKSLECATCHSGNPHELSRLSIQSPVQRDGVCARCHDANAHTLKTSVHGKGKAAARVACESCHADAPHGVQSLPAVTAANAGAVCRTCHPAQVRNVAGSAHDQHARMQGGAVNCFACHGKNPHALSAPTPASSPKGDALCRQCHTDVAKMLPASAHGKQAHLNNKAMSCFTCHGADPHTIAKSVGTTQAHDDARCKSCHTSEATELSHSAHDRTGNSKGTKVTCFACHGENPHGVAPAKHLTPLQKSAMCENCHPKAMARLVNSAHGPANVHAKTGKPLNCLTCHGNSQHAVTPPAKLSSLQKAASCRECHPNQALLVAGSVHGKEGMRNGKHTPDCTTCHATNPKDITVISKMKPRDLEKACVACHKDLSKHLASDVHMRPDKVPGDHPTCLTCHGGMAHAIPTPAKPTAKVQVQVCATCHRDAQRMKRYGISPDTVPAYEATMHGRAVLRLGHNNAAACTDCHGIHGILNPEDPNAPTAPRHTAQICAKCHKDKNMAFAYSYASHFRLKVEQSAVYPMERALLWLTLLGGLVGLVGSVGVLVVRKKIAGHPRWLDTLGAMNLLGLTTAGVMLLSGWLMSALGEATWRTPTWLGWGMLAVALLGMLVHAVLARTRA